jgi:hypothetical protein
LGETSPFEIKDRIVDLQPLDDKKLAALVVEEEVYRLAVWEIGGEEIWGRDLEGEADAVAVIRSPRRMLSPNFSTTATGGSTRVQLWDAGSGTLLLDHDQRVRRTSPARFLTGGDTGLLLRYDHDGGIFEASVQPAASFDADNNAETSVPEEEGSDVELTTLGPEPLTES